MGVFEKLIGHVIHLEFDTHESMIEAALCWQLEEYQLDSGSFRGSINAVHTLHIQIGNTFRSNGVFVKGKTPKNSYLFASVMSPQGKMTHNGLSILEDELVVLKDTDQLDFTVSSSVDDITIAIDKVFFDHAFKNYFNKAFEYDTINKRIQLKEDTGKIFRDSVKEIIADLMGQNAKLLNDPDFHERTEQRILQILFDNIDLSRERNNTLQSEMDADTIRKYIEKNYKNDICINELCSSKKLSDRTLRSGFKNLFGLSPKQYHNSYRMGKVHHALLQSDNSLDTVEGIAYEHGFTHMGHFSANYKSMFKNTPLFTLKNISF
ncbi:MAG TPA: AraC family transcriptional regulator [Sulfurovum sp.]